MKEKQTAPEETEITAEEVERQTRNKEKGQGQGKRERHRGGTGCKMKRECMGLKEW
jgi:hypothetical protein